MVVKEAEILEIEQAVQEADAEEKRAEVLITLTLTEAEFKVINQTMAAQLFSYYPQLWMRNADSDRDRMGMMNMLAVLADRAMLFFAEEQATVLGEKLATGVREFYKQVGLDFEEQQARLLNELQSTFGLEVRDDGPVGEATSDPEASPDETRPADGDQTESEAGRGSESSEGPSEVVAGADMPKLPPTDPTGSGPATPDLS